MLRVEHHWDGPKTTHEIPEGLTISTNRYWTIHILDKGESKIKGEFQYQNNVNYDQNIMANENVSTPEPMSDEEFEEFFRSYLD